MDYPNTFYAAEIDAGKPPEPLTRHLQADVCIIGGGLAGISTGLELARRGQGVVILEAHRAGWGASGRNGGIVSSGFALESEQLFQTAGKDDAWKLFGLSVAGQQYVRSQIERFNMNGVIQGEGCYLVSRRHALDEMQQLVEFYGQNLGRELTFVPTELVRDTLVTTRYHQAVYDASAFHIQPLKYALELLHQFELLGGFFFEQSRANGIRQDGGQWRVYTTNGSVKAGHVVLCTSAYDLSIFRKATRAVLPVSTYVTATEPDDGLLDEAIKTRAAVVDTRRAGDYYRRLADGRLIWGGRISTRTEPPSQMAEKLLGDAYAVYRKLGTLKPAFVWSGLMGYARHKMPLIGQPEARIWVATAFGGHGLNTTAMAGQLLSRAIAEGDDEYRLFERFGFLRAGGPFRRAAVQASYWAMQARDKLEETF
ncbi:MAG: FAD-binding oxidoreductase [Pseudomonadota bacterium]